MKKTKDARLANRIASISVDPRTYECLRRYGEGNVSLGVRRVVHTFLDASSLACDSDIGSENQAEFEFNCDSSS